MEAYSQKVHNYLLERYCIQKILCYTVLVYDTERVCPASAAWMIIAEKGVIAGWLPDKQRLDQKKSQIKL